MKNPRVTRRKEILKISAEINAKETKETMLLSFPLAWKALYHFLQRPQLQYPLPRGLIRPF